jgi:thiol-disulfide isomerase/thioredoxin
MSLTGSLRILEFCVQISRFAFAAAVAAVIVAGPSFALSAPAPMVTTVESLNELTVPNAPYDEHANADAAVDAAIARAKAQHKLLLIDLGGNWCADCRILSGVMELPEVQAFVDMHYVTVNVDVGRMNRNLQIPAHYGITDTIYVPAVLIVAPDGKLIDRDHTEALADARKMTPQAIADWLAQWTK